MRLGHVAVDVHYSSLIEELSPDETIPYLIERKLMSQETAAEMKEMRSHTRKVTAVVQSLGTCQFAGMLPTFCAALIGAGKQCLAKTLQTSE